MTRSRIGALLLSLLAGGLTVTGVVLAATDSNPGSRVRDPLALNGFPPRSAEVHLAISARQGYQVTGDVALNFVTDSLSGRLNVPLALSDLSVNVRLVEHHLYLGLANLSSVTGKSWLALASSQPSLYGISLEMTKPDISLISGFDSKSVSHSGYLTTYTFRRHHMVLYAPGALAGVLPRQGAVTLSITTGSQGELVVASIEVHTAHSDASITMSVLSYNRSAHVVAPPASAVTPLGPLGLKRLLGGSPLGGMLSPGAFSSLGQLQLN